jgi:hypothetical protein
LVLPVRIVILGTRVRRRIAVLHEVFLTFQLCLPVAVLGDLLVSDTNVSLA